MNKIQSLCNLNFAMLPRNGKLANTI